MQIDPITLYAVRLFANDLDLLEQARTDDSSICASFLAARFKISLERAEQHVREALRRLSHMVEDALDSGDNSGASNRGEFHMSATFFRYQVFPIATADCDSVNRDFVVFRTNSLAIAKEEAERANFPFGAGILDTATELLDVGFGFGVPCPSLEE